MKTSPRKSPKRRRIAKCPRKGAARKSPKIIARLDGNRKIPFFSLKLGKKVLIPENKVCCHLTSNGKYLLKGTSRECGTCAKFISKEEAKSLGC